MTFNKRKCYLNEPGQLLYKVAAAQLQANVDVERERGENSKAMIFTSGIEGEAGPGPGRRESMHMMRSTRAN